MQTNDRRTFLTQLLSSGALLAAERWSGSLGYSQTEGRRERSSIRKDIEPTSIDGFWAPSWSISGGLFTQASMNPGRSSPIKKGFAPM